MDFVHDQLATGRTLSILTVVDTYSRLSPVVAPRFSCRGADVVAALDRACWKIGNPMTIRVDNGSEFISQDMDLWAYQRGVTLDFSRPGKPTDNALIKAFNSKLRTECLNAHWFLSLEDACEKLEALRRHYNEERPHSAIGNISPIMLANSAGETSPPDLSKAETLGSSGPRSGSSAQPLGSNPSFGQSWGAWRSFVENKQLSHTYNFFAEGWNTKLMRPAGLGADSVTSSLTLRGGS